MSMIQSLCQEIQTVSPDHLLQLLEDTVHQGHSVEGGQGHGGPDGLLGRGGEVQVCTCICLMCAIIPQSWDIMTNRSIDIPLLGQMWPRPHFFSAHSNFSAPFTAFAV